MPYPCCCRQTAGKPICINGGPVIPKRDLVAYVTTRWSAGVTMDQLYADPYPCAKSTYRNYATDGVYHATNVVLGPDANETDLLCRNEWPTDLVEPGFVFPGPYQFIGPISWWDMIPGSESAKQLGAAWCSDASFPYFENVPAFLRAYGVHFPTCNLLGLYAFVRPWGVNYYATRYLGYFDWPGLGGNYETGVEYVFDQWDPFYGPDSVLQVWKVARDFLMHASVRFERAG